MIAMRARTRLDRRGLQRRAQAGSIQSLGHAGAALRLVARHSIRRSARAAPPGAPPHTRRGQLKRAIRFAVEPAQQRVFIGPTYTLVGRSAAAHEFGGRYRGQRYPQRPLMGPALSSLRNRLARFWANSVKP